MKDNTNKMRIDKWLWAARFYKTRSLAADAVENGRVLVNAVCVKPSRAIAAGDRLEIRIGQYEFLLEVLALSSKRGPAPEAQKLYLESDASRERRTALAAQLRAEPIQYSFRGRPTKRNRRLIERLKHGE